MSLWTGPNDAPLSNKEERMAELTKPACDHIIGLEQHEDRDIGLIDRRESERSRISGWWMPFAFCPICGTRIATDEQCGFTPTTDTAPASKA